MTTTLEMIAQLHKSANNTDIVADELNKVLDVMHRFDGKVINVRVIDAINDACKHIHASFDTAYFNASYPDDIAGYTHDMQGNEVKPSKYGYSYSYKFRCIQLDSRIDIMGESRAVWTHIVDISPFIDKGHDRINYDFCKLAINKEQEIMTLKARELRQYAKDIHNVIDTYNKAVETVRAIYCNAPDIVRRSAKMEYVPDSRVTDNDAKAIYSASNGAREEWVINHFTSVEYDEPIENYKTGKIEHYTLKLVCEQNEVGASCGACFDLITGNWC